MLPVTPCKMALNNLNIILLSIKSEVTQGNKMALALSKKRFLGNTFCYQKVTKCVTRKLGFHYQKQRFVTICYLLETAKYWLFTIKNAVFSPKVTLVTGNIGFRQKQAELSTIQTKTGNLIKLMKS
jgi:hypothetical protein